jgi:hypothetical protein
MFNVPPPAAKTHWVYDDPSGVAEPTPYPRAAGSAVGQAAVARPAAGRIGAARGRRRPLKRTAQVTVPNRVVRVSHMEN